MLALLILITRAVSWFSYSFLEWNIGSFLTRALAR